MENSIGRGASGRGDERTSSIARLRCFFPMYPLGHNVSDTSSIGMTNGSANDEEDWDENVRINFEDEAAVALVKHMLLMD